MRLSLCFLLCAATAGCLDPEVGEGAAPLTGDPIAACPIPSTPDGIPGHESDFYLCADAAADGGRGCGPGGYLRGYGAVYARRFYRDARPRMTRAGQAWIDGVLVCLQEELRADIDASTSCDDIRHIAFDTHPACYIEQGFCSLSLWDVANVVWTVNATDWLSHDAARQVVRTALGCGRDYASALTWLFGDLI